MLYKSVKQIGAFAFAFAAMIAYLLSEKSVNPIQPVSSNIQDTVEIVLLDIDSDCVPFTLPCSFDELEQKVIFVVDSMKTNQQAVPMFYGYLPPETKVQSVLLIDGNMVIDFNDEFLDIDPAKEIRALEAICYVFTQFDGVQSFEISVDGKKVERFNHGQVDIKQPLDDSIMLNNFETVDAILHRTNGIVIAYEKQWENAKYTTLQSIRCNDSLINCIEKYYTNQNSILIGNQLKFKEFNLSLMDKTMKIEISSEILTPQKNCDLNLITPILMTIKENFDVDTIDVYVKDVNVYTVKTSDLKYNVIR